MTEKNDVYETEIKMNGPDEGPSNSDKLDGGPDEGPENHMFEYQLEEAVQEMKLADQRTLFQRCRDDVLEKESYRVRGWEIPERVIHEIFRRVINAMNREVCFIDISEFMKTEDSYNSYLVQYLIDNGFFVQLTPDKSSTPKAYLQWTLLNFDKLV